MTSKLTREERVQSLYGLKIGQVLNPSDIESIKMLARMALAAMGSSESVELPLDYLQGHKDGLEWAAQLAEANHPETGDWLYDDPIELAKAIRKGPDMPPAQPVADSEPVIVVGDDGGDALSYRRLIQSFEPGTKLYLHAQPAPVVPEEMTIRDACKFVQDMRLFDDVSVIVMRTWNACRAAMLHAGTLTNEGTIQAVNSPVIPGWIPVSERMPEREVDVQVYCPDKKEQMVAYLERNELEGYFRFATWRTGEGIYCQPTHWMPLPAAPQEVK